MIFITLVNFGLGAGLRIVVPWGALWYIKARQNKFQNQLGRKLHNINS